MASFHDLDHTATQLAGLLYRTVPLLDWRRATLQAVYVPDGSVAKHSYTYELFDGKIDESTSPQSAQDREAIRQLTRQHWERSRVSGQPPWHALSMTVHSDSKFSVNLTYTDNYKEGDIFKADLSPLPGVARYDGHITTQSNGLRASQASPARHATETLLNRFHSPSDLAMSLHQLDEATHALAAELAAAFRGQAWQEIRYIERWTPSGDVGSSDYWIVADGRVQKTLPELNPSLRVSDAAKAHWDLAQRLGQPAWYAMALCLKDDSRYTVDFTYKDEYAEGDISKPIEWQSSGNEA